MAVNSRLSGTALLHSRMPAEWASHDATWLSWPHNEETWPGVFAAVEPAFCEIVAALAATETVHINVLDTDHRRHVARLLSTCAPSDAIRMHIVPTNDAWIRDHGAIFTVVGRDDPQRLGLGFEYNAWGGKYPPFDLDAAVAEQMVRLVDVPFLAVDAVLEGGSVDVDGAGLLLTTEQCLLNPNRNPHLDRFGIEQLLARHFGVEAVLWLGQGIEGDDTDGHVDDMARFFAPRSVVTVVESDKADPNFRPLDENLRRLRNFKLPDDARLTIVQLPMPEPQFNDGHRLPASYANFYVANELVLVPTFNCPADDVACGILGDCFPGRGVVPVDCRALVAGLGALHCLTQQVPAVPPALSSSITGD